MATEMRLIDANKLPYSIAVDDNGKQIFYVKAEDIDKAPTVDAIEVVRCRDCKHFEAPQGVPVCGNFFGLGFPNPDGSNFCSYGERRTDEKN